jgi:lysozyme family protein
VQNFATAFKLVIDIEKGYWNDPAGGPTKYGISQRAYPSLDIANLTLDQAMTALRRDYWNHCNCDALPAPLDVYAFDCAVNQGQETAARMLQNTVGVNPDGIIGSATVAAAVKLGAEGAAMFMARRAKAYMAARDFERFGDGWLKRLFILAASC